jgi:hypothetical protein
MNDSRRPTTRTVAALVLLTVLCFTPKTAVAQSVGGRVMEEGSLQPIAYAGVALIDPAGTVVVSTVADSLGSFYLRAEPGSYRLRAQRIGYATSTSESILLRENEPVIVELRLSASGVPLEPLIVRARGIERGEDGFARRRALGEGVFLDQDSVTLREPKFAWDVFRGVEGIQFRMADLRPRIYSFSGGRCMAIYVNHNARPFMWDAPSMSRTDRLGQGRRTTVTPGNPALAMDGVGLDHILAGDIRGVEVYRNFWEIPDELRTADRIEALWPGQTKLPCGMAVIWTKVAW